jgi:hypothetical protein
MKSILVSFARKKQFSKNDNPEVSLLEMNFPIWNGFPVLTKLTPYGHAFSSLRENAFHRDPGFLNPIITRFDER